ncbi:hypothetical protein WJX81_004223 [Elliptochloris bilobata]|uniref:Uncharacterized protein n=1 Tax=Elliptochloris bilobata TaxID=381761 RepID=A0AAW1RMR1_9CHLO
MECGNVGAGRPGFRRFKLRERMSRKRRLELPKSRFVVHRYLQVSAAKRLKNSEDCWVATKHRTLGNQPLRKHGASRFASGSASNRARRTSSSKSAREPLANSTPQRSRSKNLRPKSPSKLLFAATKRSHDCCKADSGALDERTAKRAVQPLALCRPLATRGGEPQACHDSAAVPGTAGNGVNVAQQQETAASVKYLTERLKVASLSGRAWDEPGHTLGATGEVLEDVIEAMESLKCKERESAQPVGGHEERRKKPSLDDMQMDDDVSDVMGIFWAVGEGPGATLEQVAAVLCDRYDKLDVRVARNYLRTHRVISAAADGRYVWACPDDIAGEQAWDSLLAGLSFSEQQKLRDLFKEVEVDEDRAKELLSELEDTSEDF